MTSRNRSWLRTFLRLDARAIKDGIPLPDVERQEDTVLRALDMLETRPGIVLADEVGMGKTYEALGIAAAERHLKPDSRVVVVTPGPDLNTKWSGEFNRFEEMYDFGDHVFTTRRLTEFVEAVRQHPVVIAPVTMFSSGRDSSSSSYLLSLYCHWKQLHGHTAKAIFSRVGDGNLKGVDVRTARFLDAFTLDQVTPFLEQAFRRSGSDGPAALDDLYEDGELAAFESKYAVRNALYHARFILTGHMIPSIDLLIVDEAHKLKNPGSLRTRAMRQVFKGRFRKALFLTATPFQLDVSELREIFALFADARDAPASLNAQVEELLDTIRQYQEHYDAFQNTWSSLDPLVAARFREQYDRDPNSVGALDDASLAIVAKQIATLRDLKNTKIEPGLRSWMIRSLREDKRIYRQHMRDPVTPAGADALPFLLYERFIDELFAQDRKTHRAAVEINMVSSYAAASDGALLHGTSSTEALPAEAAAYRTLLQETLSSLDETQTSHPKLQRVIADALDAADRREKTLIFCSRVSTLVQVRRDLDRIWEERLVERWRRIYPNATADQIFDTREADESRHRGQHSLLQRRFHRPQDPLFLALREPYLYTVLPIAKWTLEHLPRVMEEANRRARLTRLGRSSAERVDYQIARRCIEQSAAELWCRENDESELDSTVLTNIRAPEYLELGLDLERDDYEHDAHGEFVPDWTIDERVARLVIGNEHSMWGFLQEWLAPLAIRTRVRVVEQLARYLTYKQVPFLPDLLHEVSTRGLSVDPVESTGLLEAMPRFWRSVDAEPWLTQIQQFLAYFSQRDEQHQLEILGGPIKTAEFARHTRDGESRERLREAFNTPLYPMILIANEVMQEGLDLHKHCRRIVHHDLVWNPAQVEQRIGRIDRLGSLTHRLRKENISTTLDVLYPVIRGTIDERMFRTVKTREKWLEFLLGAAPKFSEYSFGEADPPPLPERLGADLAIALGPK